MKNTLTLRPIALSEIEDAWRWYENQREEFSSQAVSYNKIDYWFI
jgi:hypothetical protein